MRKHTILIQYLRKLGFIIDMQPDETVCTHGNNIIVFKRGKLSEPHYQVIKTQLMYQGYKIPDYDSLFLTAKKYNKFVYVTVDPLLEEVICVHAKPNKLCSICNDTYFTRIKEDSFYLLYEKKMLIRTNLIIL